MSYSEFQFKSYQEKKEEIWLSPMTKAPKPTEMSKGQSDNTNNATKKFDYTAVALQQVLIDSRFKAKPNDRARGMFETQKSGCKKAGGAILLK